MKAIAGSYVVSLAVMFAVTTLVLGCRPRHTKHIPLTTTSTEAREHFAAGMDMIERYRRAEAREHFAAAIAADSNFAMAYLGLALVQPTQQETFEQLDTAEGMSRPETQSVPRRARLGVSLSSVLVDEASAEMIGEAARRVSKVSEGERLWILGNKATLDRDRQGQYECFGKLVELYPEDERAQRLMGDCYWRHQEIEKAIASFERATKLNPGYAAAFNMLGYCHAQNQDFAAAERAFVQYIALLPDEPNPYDSYAELLLRMGRYDESMDNYRKALYRDSTFVNARIGLAANLCFLERHTEAREYLRWPGDSALPADWQRSLTLCRALSHIEAKEYEPAAAILSEQVNTSRARLAAFETASDLVALGRVLAERRPAEGQEKFDAALNALVQSDLPQSAIERYRVFIDIVGGCYVAVPTGDLDRAWRILRDAEQQTSLSGLHEFELLLHQLRGMVAMAEGRDSTAIAELKQASLDDGYNLHRLGTLMERQGDPAAARDYYKRAAKTHSFFSVSTALARPLARSALKRLAKTVG